MSERVFFGTLATGGGARPGSGAFRVLLIGDFSGRAARGVQAPLAGRKVSPLDVDNWERVLASLRPEALVPAGEGGPAFSIQPEEIDDFRPDALFDKLDVFKALRSLRKRLQDPTTFEAAAAEVRSWAGAPAAGPAPSAPEPAAGGEADGDTLSRLLGDRPPQAAPPPAQTAQAGIDAILRSVVGPYIVPDTKMEQSALLGRLDDAVAAQMRAVLRHDGFRCLEAAWRSVHFLVTHLETDEDLQLHLMDATKAELIADLMAGDDLQSTALFKRLVTETVGTQGGKPWSLVAVALPFDKAVLDASLLGRLVKIAKAAGAPIVAAAKDRVAGCESLAATPDPEDWTVAADADGEAAWAALRQLPEARWLALGLPRMLLRLPYGRETDPIDRFEFEELVEGGGHEGYLWGSPAFALVAVLGAGFTERGWAMAPELYRDVEDLPMHVHTDAEGERQVMPCAEVYLSDRAGQALQDMGVTALLSVQGSNRLRLRGVAALADPVTALAGPWNG
ncbi:MAG TPA: type VI secretion system contractile sheath large subunit [Phycisphaerae bacterium]|nr:type VI secretion system contractile sheath large subunit [Phycisphaerae bacterium]